MDRDKLGFLVTVIVIAFVVVGFGALFYYDTASVVWHDTGVVMSVGHFSSYNDQTEQWETHYNATVLTQNHGTLTFTDRDTCPFLAACSANAVQRLQVHEHIGVIEKHTNIDGNYYDVQEWI